MHLDNLFKDLRQLYATIDEGLATTEPAVVFPAIRIFSEIYERERTIGEDGAWIVGYYANDQVRFVIRDSEKSAMEEADRRAPEGTQLLLYRLGHAEEFFERE